MFIMAPEWDNKNVMPSMTSNPGSKIRHVVWVGGLSLYPVSIIMTGTGDLMYTEDCR